jgi:hypothetical protein
MEMVQPRLLRPLVAVLMIVVAVAVVGRQRVAAQTPPAVAPSPEELLLSILQYRLQPSDTPAGFVIRDQQAVTPARRAFDQGNDATESQSALQDIQQSGMLTGFLQILGPNNVTPVRLFVYQVSLYDSSSHASAALQDALDVPSARGISSDNPPLTVPLGDEAGAVHIAITRPNSDNRFLETVVWRRGRVLFEADLLVLDGTETLDQVLPFAQSADRKAAALTPPAPVPAATLPYAGSEQLRVDAIYALADRLPGAEESPYGFRPESGSIVSNADLLLQSVDPRATYGRIASTWKRVVEVEITFDTPQTDTGDALHIHYALDSDAASASADLLDPLRLSSGPFDTYSLPQPLGDSSRLYHETFTSPEGVPFESWRAVWTHGLVVVSVYSTGPVGDFTAQQVAAFAATVDARYSRGAVPGVLTQPVPAPTPIPPVT